MKKNIKVVYMYMCITIKYDNNIKKKNRWETGLASL